MSNGVIIIDPSCFMCHASRRVCRTPVVYAINGKVLVSKICIFVLCSYWFWCQNYKIIIATGLVRKAGEAGKI